MIAAFIIGFLVLIFVGIIVSIVDAPAKPIPIVTSQPKFKMGDRVISYKRETGVIAGFIIPAFSYEEYLYKVNLPSGLNTLYLESELVYNNSYVQQEEAKKLLGLK